MNANICLKWIRHFVQNYMAVKDLDIIVFEHPTAQYPQVIDTFLKPFEFTYTDECDLWMRSYPAVRISKYEISGFVVSAFIRISSMDNGYLC